MHKYLIFSADSSANLDKKETCAQLSKLRDQLKVF